MILWGCAATRSESASPRFQQEQWAARGECSWLVHERDGGCTVEWGLTRKFFEYSDAGPDPIRLVNLDTGNEIELACGASESICGNQIECFCQLPPARSDPVDARERSEVLRITEEPAIGCGSVLHTPIRLRGEQPNRQHRRGRPLVAGFRLRQRQSGPVESEVPRFSWEPEVGRFLQGVQRCKEALQRQLPTEGIGSEEGCRL